jgi:hypothetical protein
MQTYNETQQKIADFLAGIPSLACGLGTKITPCSIAALNLALSGRLTDEIPECASRVIGRWVIRVQDACPADVGRDNPVWRKCLPLLAGTCRSIEHEKQRLDLILSWMWDCLALNQPLADKRGYGKEWAEMCLLRTRESALVARKAAAAYAYADAAAYAAAAYAAADAADAYAAAAYAAADAADAYADADAAAYARREFWIKANPSALLEQLVSIGYVEKSEQP